MTLPLERPQKLAVLAPLLVTQPVVLADLGEDRGDCLSLESVGPGPAGHVEGHGRLADVEQRGETGLIPSRLPERLDQLGTPPRMHGLSVYAYTSPGQATLSMRTHMVDSTRFSGVARDRDLTPEQNAKLREQIKVLLETRSQTALAKSLGVTQPTISAFQGKRQGASFGLALKVAKLRGLDVWEMLGEERPPKLPSPRLIDVDDQFPERTAALAGARVVAKRYGFTEEDIEAVAKMDLDFEDDPGIAFWWGQLKSHRKRRRAREKGLPETAISKAAKPRSHVKPKVSSTPR